MAAYTEIDAPFTLASLPHSNTSSGWRAQAASVYSLSGTKKRKRTELAVGVDGEGIYIYSLQNPQLVTSYALPLETSFTSPPYSIYHKRSTKRPSRRYTYAFVTQPTGGEKSRLVCFTQDARKDASAQAVQTSYTPSNPAHNLLAIDVVPVAPGGSDREGTHDVLAAFENGDAICLSSDLETVRWVANIKSLAPSLKQESEIEHACISTARAVTRGLLRSRADITAILNPSLDDKSDLLDLVQVLGTIIRHPNGTRALALIEVSPRSADLPNTQLSPLKHLLTWNLPATSPLPVATADKPHYLLNSSSGTLHMLAGSALVSYDFSGTIPRISSRIATPAPAIQSFLRISQNVLLTTSAESCQILDVKYSSIQARLPLGLIPSPSRQEPKKRKQSASAVGEDASVAPVFVAFYVDLRLAVAIWKNEVVGFQVKSAVKNRVKTESTRLIDALGKGVQWESSPSGPLFGKHDFGKWQERSAKLDKYLRQGNIAKFEALFAENLGIELESVAEESTDEPQAVPPNRTKDAVTKNGSNEPLAASYGVDAANLVEDSSEQPLRRWKLPKSIACGSRLTHQQYALYALSRIFHYVPSQSSQDSLRHSLRISFFPPNVFQWLLHSGYLTKESIRQAISNDSSTSLDALADLVDGDIVRAIVEFDPDLQILSAVLSHRHFLPIAEVVQAIKLIVQSLDDGVHSETTTKLLTNGDEPVDGMDIDITSELEAASREIDRALSILDNGLAIRSSNLRPALIRLHTFPSATITSSLRSMLPRPDLESLIRLLHHEFKNGGWTSPYASADSETSPGDRFSEETDDSAVAIIASLLSCTLDAIGPAMWLTTDGGTTSDTSTEDLIGELLQDTSIALNGFWEATYIRGLVSELLRYTSKLPKSQKPSNKALQRQGKPLTLEVKPDELPMLPLGAKPDMGIERTRAGKGGKNRERSAREMGMLISQRVPKYSLERITF